MATENNVIRKYLDITGLTLYTDQLKTWLAGVNQSGVIGLADKAVKLQTPRRIELAGGVTGDGTFDGSNNVTITTTLHLPNSITADLVGNALTANNFSNPRPISLTGAVTGYAIGGTSSDGWAIQTSLADESVTAAKLLGNIPNSKLSNSAITLGSTPISLGGTATTISGLTSVSAGNFVGNLTGTADQAVLAEKDASGNVITTTYATKAEVQAAASAFNFKGEIDDLSHVTNPSNGDIYTVNGQSYIWSAANNQWESFGSTYGPATANDFGLIKIGSNLSYSNGVLSLSGANVDAALGYNAIQTVKVNGVTLIPDSNRAVDVIIPNNYATQADITAAFTRPNIISALGAEPVESISLNNVDLAKVNNRVNIDLSDYATQTWTRDAIDAVAGSLYTFKGSVQTYGDLLNVQSPSVGDTYNVIQGNDEDLGNPEWPAFVAGTNFSWDGDEWDSLGGSLDLSNYYKKAEINSLLAGKASLDHHHNSLYYTKTEVDTLLANLKTWTEAKIAAALSSQADSGMTNDVRTYSTYSAFPNPGIPDVIYVDSATGVMYSWVEEVQGEGAYRPLSQTVTPEEISGMFD